MKASLAFFRPTRTVPTPARFLNASALNFQMSAPASTDQATFSAPPTVNKVAHEFEKQAFDGLMIKRFFFAPAFEIYGGKQTRRSAERRYREGKDELE